MLVQEQHVQADGIIHLPTDLYLGQTLTIQQILTLEHLCVAPCSLPLSCKPPPSSGWRRGRTWGLDLLPLCQLGSLVCRRPGRM